MSDENSVRTPTGFVWQPSEDFKGVTNWIAFLAANDVASYALLEDKAASNPEWFWNAVTRFLI